MITLLNNSLEYEYEEMSGSTRVWTRFVCIVAMFRKIIQLKGLATGLTVAASCVLFAGGLSLGPTSQAAMRQSPMEARDNRRKQYGGQARDMLTTANIETLNREGIVSKLPNKSQT